MKILVLLNAAAGSAGQSSPADLSARIQEGFAKHGVEATIKAVRGPELAATAKAARRDSGLDAVVAAGGDGTISAAAAALSGGDLPLGILPLGTLNHFAKDLGLPLDLESAIAVIAEGNVRRVDLGEVNGRIFVNNSSVGLYPFMVARRNVEQQRSGLSKATATLSAALRALLQAPWRTLGIAAAGSRKRVRTPCVFIGNNPYHVGLTAFGTRQSLDSGELCVHVVRRQTRVGILLLPLKVALGLADPVRDVETFSAVDVEITSRKRHMRVSLDGEITALQTPLRYRSLPGALGVLARPAAEPAR